MVERIQNDNGFIGGTLHLGSAYNVWVYFVFTTVFMRLYVLKSNKIKESHAASL